MTPWQIAATIPVRIVAPACFDETFTTGLTPYSTIFGNINQWTIVSTPYGQGIDAPAEPPAIGTTEKIGRSISVTARTYSFKYKTVSPGQADDAANIWVNSGGINGSIAMYFNPRRERAFDTNQRPVLQLNSEFFFCGTTGTETALDTWYQVDITVIAGAGNSTWKITRLSDSVIVLSGNFTQAHVPTAVDTLMWNIDSGSVTTTTETQYADIHFCP